jgi:hypothetical protein
MAIAQEVTSLASQLADRRTSPTAIYAIVNLAIALFTIASVLDMLDDE